MKMQTLTPHPAIAKYISNIVVLEDGYLKSDILIPLIAKGYPSIAFQATGQSSIKEIKTIENSFVLYGQNIQPFQFHASKHLTIIAYFLHPHMLKTLFRFNACESSDLSVDLSYSQPARQLNLQERLVNEPSLGKRLELMNCYILELSKFIRTDVDKTIWHATNEIIEANGLVSLKEIENKLHMTERTFQRLFKLHVGVSPKAFSRICQFQSAFGQLEKGGNSKLGDIAWQSGYADQSHLNRAFKEFTGCTPREYLKFSGNF